MYSIVLMFMQPSFGLSGILSFGSIGIITGIVAISWIPLFSIHLLRKRIQPTDDEKIRKNALSSVSTFSEAEEGGEDE